MLRLRIARNHLRRVARTQTQYYHFQTSSKSTPIVNNVVAYITSASVVTMTGFWWLTAARDDVPRLREMPTEQVLVTLSLHNNEVTRMLSKGAYSLEVRNVAGVNRYDGAQLASNSPCEDRFTHGQFSLPWNDDSPWMTWAVFDGHSGWQTADLLEKRLIPSVQDSLGRFKPTSEERVPDEFIQRAIKKAFLDVDNSIVKTGPDISQSEESLQEKMQKLAPAFAGSCALLSVYDSVTRNLHVACTGDSRAVLGEQDSDGKWKAVPLSVDQTGNNKEEIARLNREHPGEEGIAKDGRVLGLVVSRAFGDGRWKWPAELQEDLNRRFYGPSPLSPRYNIETPPYITAEPAVTTTKIDSDRPSFLILATDGMWDSVSNQQAVDLVGTWLESQTKKTRDIKPEPTYGQFDFGEFWKGVPWKFVEERTTTQDDNVAVHLMRNTLGGNHHELVAGRLAVSAPLSRKLRDDITIQVVFFNTPGVEKK
ncbi:probable protein phosphatase 2C/pyruvate dehydrogenase (lipoamide) phosphatase [Rhynchosporium agropyri]|uniref:Probable protein phosphatase 2C/pyruvate dehydrogenase (Lipoamide) phosphatase n=1 Tax=Rhynchosporium agropyri TaxID=914238 RepID=A0A1E1LE21_9HELO|nr:probable protein phosphatase 2C/pyruvate dehydrogenase (lipoamide) phosphatase [Rhynchosporium agropyri]